MYYHVSFPVANKIKTFRADHTHVNFVHHIQVAFAVYETLRIFVKLPTQMKLFLHVYIMFLWVLYLRGF